MISLYKFIQANLCRKSYELVHTYLYTNRHTNLYTIWYNDKFILFISVFLIQQVLAHLEPYLQIQRNLLNELTSMAPQTNNTCRKRRVSAFQWS